MTFRDVRDIDHSVTVHAETTMDAAALGLKRIREQKFVMEDLSDSVKGKASSGSSIKRQGRPPGSTNKPKASAPSTEIPLANADSLEDPRS
jgi:hypothetical protein